MPRWLGYRQSFVEGLTAGSLALMVAFLIRIGAGGVFLPELAAQALFSQTPGAVESMLVLALGALAKYLAVVGAAGVNLALYGVLGALLPRVGGFRSMALYTATTYVIHLALTYLFTTLTDISTIPLTPLAIAYQLLPPQLVYGFLLYTTTSQANPTTLCEPGPEGRPKLVHRRRLLVGGGVVGLASALLYIGLAPLFAKSGRAVVPAQPPAGSERGGGRVAGPFGDPAVKPLLAGEVTPNDRFYRVDVNFQPPAVDPATWRLKVWGLVKKPLKLGYEELKALPAVEEYATLECVSNGIGGDLVSTAQWRGVRLRDLLKLAGVMEEAVYIVFRCQDGYDVGIPLERGLMEGTLLAYEMNGAPLPREHGFPLRAVVPGYYGMMNPKWITEIEVVGKPYEGFWQRRGWANEATYQTHSWIALPGEGRLKERFPGLKSPRLRVGRRTVVAGIAFAGDRGIKRVEVSVDGGKTWEEATVKDPLSGYTWVLWAKEWTPQDEGSFRLMVRATDGDGFVQLAEVRQPFPAGATGYHIVEVKVEREG